MKLKMTISSLLSCIWLALAPEFVEARSGAPSATLPSGMSWVAPGVVRLSRHDPGGYLASYLVGLEKLKRLGVRQLQIDAACASACTVYLRLGNRVCLTRRGRLGFHRVTLHARSRFAPIRARMKSAEHRFNDRFLKRLPANIRSWPAIRNGLPQRIVWLTGEEATHRIGRCQ